MRACVRASRVIGVNVGSVSRVIGVTLDSNNGNDSREIGVNAAGAVVATDWQVGCFDGR